MSGFNVIDRIGQRYGRLTVTERVASRSSKDGARWQCICDCGKVSTANSHSLTAGLAKSCGCTRLGPRSADKLKLMPGVGARNSILAHYRCQARDRSLDWGLSTEEFENITQSNCHYCGVAPFKTFQSVRSKNGSYTYNGIDRMDNSRGYNKDNVVPCCSICNHAKATMSYVDFIAWADRFSRYQLRELINKQG